MNLISKKITQPDKFKYAIDSAKLIGDKLELTGWMLATDGIEKIEIYLNKVLIGNATTSLLRADVASVYPDFPNNLNAGFGFSGGNGQLIGKYHMVSIRIVESNSNINELVFLVNRLIPEHTDIESAVSLESLQHPINSVITTNEEVQVEKSEEEIDSFDKFIIDSMVFYQDFFEINGWGLSSVGVDKIEIFIDDNLIGEANYGTIREDVGKAFDYIADSNNSGFFIKQNYSFNGEKPQYEITVKMTNKTGKSIQQNEIISASDIKTTNMFHIDDIIVYEDWFEAYGWAVSKNGIKKIEVYIDDVYAGTAETGFERPDIGELYDFIPNSSKAGIKLREGFKFNQSLSGYNFKFVATFKDNYELRITNYELSNDEPDNSIVNNVQREIIYQQYVESNKIRSSKILTVDFINFYEDWLEISGWAVSNSHIKQIEAFIDDVSYGLINFGHNRIDIGKIYNFLPEAEKSGYYYFTYHKFTDKDKVYKVSMIMTCEDGSTKYIEDFKTIQLTDIGILSRIIQDNTFLESEINSKPEMDLTLVCDVYNIDDAFLTNLRIIESKNRINYPIYVIYRNSFLDEDTADVSNLSLIFTNMPIGALVEIQPITELTKNNILYLTTTNLELPDCFMERISAGLEMNDNVALLSPFSNIGTFSNFNKFQGERLDFTAEDINELNEAYDSVNFKNNRFELLYASDVCVGINTSALKQFLLNNKEINNKSTIFQNNVSQLLKNAGLQSLLFPNLYVGFKGTAKELYGGRFGWQDVELPQLDMYHKIRNFIALQISIRRSSKNVFILDHDLGGGANSYRNNLKELYIEQDCLVVVFTFNFFKGYYNLNAYYKDLNIPYIVNEIEELNEIFDFFDVEEVFVNNLVSYKDTLKLLKKLIELKKITNFNLITPVHDYYCVCPSYVLLNNQGKFCNIPDDLSVCNACMASNQLNLLLFKHDDIGEWRRIWGELLSLSSRVIVFSMSSKRLVTKAYPFLNLDLISIEPHKVEPLQPINLKAKKDSTLNIGVIGHISFHKGSEVIKSMVETIDREYNGQIKIVVIGNLYEKIQSENLVVTGTYSRDELPGLIVSHGIDIIFMPSICPETFSYSTSEVISMELPIASFDIGAHAERIKLYKSGYIIDDISAEAAMEFFLDYLKKNYEVNYNLEQKFWESNPHVLQVDRAVRYLDSIAVFGWAALPDGIKKIEFRVNDELIGLAHHGMFRPDIKKNWQFEGSDTLGFRFSSVFTKQVPVEKIKIFMHNYVRGIVDEEFPVKNWDSHYKEKYVSKEYNDQELDRMVSLNYDYEPKFSIVAVVENPNPSLLVQLFDTLIEQTYYNWELIIIDTGTTDFYTKELLVQYSYHSSRIKPVFFQNKKIDRNYELRITNSIINNGACSIVTNDHLPLTIDLIDGDYICLLNYQDLPSKFTFHEIVEKLNTDRSIDFIYTDEDIISFKQKRTMPNFKPDWSPEFMLNSNYIGSFFVFDKSMFDSFNDELIENIYNRNNYFISLLLTSHSRNICHIPKVLFHRRQLSLGDQKYKIPEFYQENEFESLSKFIAIKDLNASVDETPHPGIFNLKYNLNGERELVSIIIPTKDKVKILETCISSILQKTTYQNYEVLVIDNGSTEEQTFEYYKSINNPTVKILNWNHEFNFSEICNFGARSASGKYLLFLNCDTEVISEDWLERLVEYAGQKDIGAVGAKLYYPDGMVQHGGVTIGIGGLAGHAHRHYPRESAGYFGRLKAVNNFSAVTAACLMTRKDVFEEISGFDERLAVALNDVDLCLKIISLGYRIVWTPHCELNHHESAFRGYEDSPEKVERFNNEIEIYYEKWGNIADFADPYYNPNLTLVSEDFVLKS
ncbi:MAG: glycosyl transferase family 2 [Ignavibacteria bacterium]|nr:glycosyl transferase family 2 [Ignavibacteria bacterium]